MREQAKVCGARPVAEVEARKIEMLERRVWSMVDVVYYPSDQETAYVQAAVPGTLARTLPAFGFKDFAPQEEFDLSGRHDILFVGGFVHEPNEDAVLWFVNDILPIVRRHEPNVRIWLVGSNPTTKVHNLAADPSIAVTGYVSDEQLATYYRNTRVVIAPLRFGAGTERQGRRSNAFRRSDCHDAIWRTGHGECCRQLARPHRARRVCASYPCAPE